MKEREPDWDMIMEQDAEAERDWFSETWMGERPNDDMFRCPSCGAMPGEPHREPCPF